MIVIKEDTDGYDARRRILPESASTGGKHYIWYHYRHRPHMLKRSRQQGKADYCMSHRDGRCTKGWEEGWNCTVAPPEPKRTLHWVRFDQDGRSLGTVKETV